MRAAAQLSFLVIFTTLKCHDQTRHGPISRIALCCSILHAASACAVQWTHGIKKHAAFVMLLMAAATVARLASHAVTLSLVSVVMGLWALYSVDAFSGGARRPHHIHRWLMLHTGRWRLLLLRFAPKPGAAHRQPRDVAPTTTTTHLLMHARGHTHVVREN